MGDQARRQASRAIGHNVVKRSGDQRSGPIGPRMRKAKGQRHNDEREPGESAKRHHGKFFRDQIPQQKSAPENFLNTWNDKNEPEEANGERYPIQRRLVGDSVEIEAKNARRETQ